MTKANRINLRRAARLGAASVVLIVAACSPVTRNDGGLNFPFAGGYQNTRDSAPLLLNNDAWWMRMQDPVLNQLINLAISQNLDLGLAIERVRQAKDQAGTVPGDNSVIPSAQIRREGLTDGPSESTASVGFEWLLDPFGGRAASRRAAAAQIDVAAAELDAARLLVILNTASTYVDLRYRERLVSLRQRELAGRKRTLALILELAKAEESNRLDTTRSRARVAELEAQLPILRADVQSVTNELAVLLGVIPSEFMMPQTGVGHIPHPNMSPQVGIPTDLLRNRPDVRVAEGSYYVALADLEVADAARFPSLSLSGAISLNLLSNNSSGAQYAFGPSVRFPDLIGDTDLAAVNVRESVLRQTHHTWQSTVLDAILEVENALLEYQAVTASAVSSARATRLYRDAQGLTKEVFDAGEATLTDLIDAETNVARSETAEADTARARALAFVALNVRIGAGHAVLAKPVTQ